MSEKTKVIDLNERFGRAAFPSLREGLSRFLFSRFFETDEMLPQLYEHYDAQQRRGIPDDLSDLSYLERAEIYDSVLEKFLLSIGPHLSLYQVFSNAIGKELQYIRFRVKGEGDVSYGFHYMAGKSKGDARPYRGVLLSGNPGAAPSSSIFNI